MSEILSLLTDKDDKKAYAKVKEIAAASELSPEYYPYIDAFASLLDHEKSYIRVRAFMLICSQARWDEEGRMERLLPQLMVLFNDPKPTVVRQCINAVKEIVAFRPELKEEIRDGLQSVDTARCRDSMRPLIEKDIREVLELIDE